MQLFIDGPSGLFHLFPDIWYEVFIWCLFSSIGIYVCAALVAFLTLRKHKFGRFYSLRILLMGFFLPLTLGVVSSASIAFVYKTSRLPCASYNFDLPNLDMKPCSFEMSTFHAMIWGVGQTVVHALFGYFRLLATL